MAQHTVIEDIDFGVPVGVLRPGKMDLFDTPIEAIEARKSAPVVKTEKVRMEGFKEPKKGAAMTAAKNEAEGGLVTFTYDEETYTVPKMEEWDLDVFEQMETNPLSSAKTLLGDDQWKAFKSKKRTMKDLNSLFEALGEAQGLKPGE